MSESGPSALRRFMGLQGSMEEDQHRKLQGSKGGLEALAKLCHTTLDSFISGLHMGFVGTNESDIECDFGSQVG